MKSIFLAKSFVTCVAVLIGTNAAFADNASSAAQVQAKQVFATPIQWVGVKPPPEAESEALLAAFGQFDTNGIKAGFSAIEKYLDAYPDSAWVPSLQVNLAEYYRMCGRYSLALDHWSAAWDETKGHQDKVAQKLAVRTVARWARLLASLGEKEKLTALFADLDARHLPLGSYHTYIEETREGLATMNASPGRAYRCGSYALGRVAMSLGVAPEKCRILFQTNSPDGGFKMSQLLTLAKETGVKVQAVRRPAGGAIIVPSVVHWKLNHYAAIVQKKGDKYLVVDPTFRGHVWMDADTIAEESSGEFLVPEDQVPADWQILTKAECAGIYGKGYPNDINDGNDSPPDQDCNSDSDQGDASCDPPTANDGVGGGDLSSGCCPPGGGFGSGGPGSGPGGAGSGPGGAGSGPGGSGSGNPFERGRGGWGVGVGGMPQWSVSEPYCTVWLEDVPLLYHRSNGKWTKLKLTYKHRDDPKDDLICGFGPKWNCNWLEWVHTQPAVSDVAIWHAPLGGHFDQLLNQTTPTPDYVTGRRLYTCTGTCPTPLYVLTPAGGTIKYGVVHGTASGTTNYFADQRIDRYGRSMHFHFGVFGSSVRLTNVVDLDGRTNTLTYGNSTFTNLITTVTDPYGRSAYFHYDDQGRLTNIVDMAGMTSSFEYDSNDEITNMTTPYGQTSFEAMSGVASNYYNVSRRATLVTEANGQKQLYEYCDLGYEGHPDSYHWNRAQYEAISAEGKSNVLDMPEDDYLKGQWKEWLRNSLTNGDYVTDTLSLSANAWDPAISFRPGYMQYTYSGQDQGLIGDMKRLIQAEYIYPDSTLVAMDITRNDLGRPTSFTYHNSYTGSATYTNIFDSSGELLQKVLGPHSELVRGYGYDPVITNLLTSVTNAVGDVLRYTHDTTTMKVTSITFPSGLVRTNIYYSSGPREGFLKEQADLGFRTNYFVYDEGNLIMLTNELGLVLSNAYDDLNRLVCTYYPDGTTISNQYDKLDVVGVKDRLDQWTHYGYNAVQQLTAATNANGQITEYDYCSCGSPSEITRWNGSTPLITYYNYDLDGRLTNAIYPDGYELNYSYGHADYQVTSITDSSGRQVTADWGYYGGTHKLTDAYLDDLYAFYAQYDEYGRLTYMTDRNGVTTTNGYDYLGRLVARQYFGGYDQSGLETFGYTARGMTNYTDALGRNTAFVRDAAARLLYRTNANNEVLQFTYNPADELLTLSDGKNQTTHWHYDRFGLVTNKVDDAGHTIFIYKYDADNQLTNRWSAAKGNTAYAYDPVGNLTNVGYPSSSDLEFRYDGLSRLTNMLDGIGSTVFSWTDGSQLASEDGPWADDTVSYTYASRLRSQLSLTQPNAAPWTQGYGYDQYFRLTNVVSAAGAFNYWYPTGSSWATTLPEYLDYPTRDESGSGFQTYIQYGYDGLGRLTQTYLRTPQFTPLNEHQYLYDAGSQRTQQVFTVYDSYSHYLNYAYDNIGQLKSARGYENDGTPRLQEQFGYAYDSAWNLRYRTNNALVQTFGVNNLNELTNATRAGTLTVAGQSTLLGAGLDHVTVSGTGLSSGNAEVYADGSWARTNATLADGDNTYTATAVEYAWLNGRTAQDSVTVHLPATNTFVYDLNGNLRTNGTRVYDYDDENQLIRVTEPGTWKSEFSYDGLLRRRITKRFAWTGSAWLQTNEVRYIYNGRLVIQERDGNNLPEVSYTRGNDLSGSLHGAGGIGGLVARTDNRLMTIGDPSAHAYYQCDGSGNITCMVNSNGVAVARYEYDPYGNLLGMAGPLAQANSYRFSSKEWDANSGLYYYGFRFYSPNLQRWLNRDPIQEWGGLCLYESARNNPMKWIDPLGLQCDEDSPKFEKEMETDPKESIDPMVESEIEKNTKEWNKKFWPAPLNTSGEAKIGPAVPRTEPAPSWDAPWSYDPREVEKGYSVDGITLARELTPEEKSACNLADFLVHKKEQEEDLERLREYLKSHDPGCSTCNVNITDAL